MSTYKSSNNTNINSIVLDSIDSNILESIDSDNLDSIDSDNLDSIDSDNLESIDSEILESIDSEILDSMDSEILDSMDSKNFYLCDDDGESSDYEKGQLDKSELKKTYKKYQHKLRKINKVINLMEKPSYIRVWKHSHLFFDETPLLKGSIEYNNAINIGLSHFKCIPYLISYKTKKDIVKLNYYFKTSLPFTYKLPLKEFYISSDTMIKEDNKDKILIS